MKLKKKSALALAALVGVSIIGATVAYWNQTTTVTNPFDTAAKYGSTVVEKFSPAAGKNWEPGVTVEKSVTIVNNGDTDVIVRAKLDESWTYKNGTIAYKDSDAANAGYDVYTVNQADPADGLTAADQSVVYKNFADGNNWVKGSDGWYYYIANLKAGETAPDWMESVMLAEDTDMGTTKTTYYVTSDDPDATDANWFEYTGTMPVYIDSNGNPVAEGATGAKAVKGNKTEITIDKEGYSNSNYLLTITVQTVQATQKAVNATFGGGAAFTAPAGCSWDLK